MANEIDNHKRRTVVPQDFIREIKSFIDIDIRLIRVLVWVILGHFRALAACKSVS